MEFSEQETIKMLRWTAPPKTLFYPGTGNDITRVLLKFSHLVDRFYFNDIGALFPNLFAELQDVDRFRALLDNPAITVCPASKTIPKKEDVEYLDRTLKIADRKIRFRFYQCDHTDAMKHMREKNIKIDFLVLRGAGGEGGSNFYDVFKNSYQKRGTRMVTKYDPVREISSTNWEWEFIGGWKLFKSVCNPKIVLECHDEVSLVETMKLRM
jgi:hypothetical protein